MHIINLNYLENKSFYFTKLLNDNTEKLNKILEKLTNTAAILDNNNEHPLDLPTLETK